MDIATHAMAGTIIASPLFHTAPLTASCFILGSTIPDLDALSRMFGKTAFLRWHQTYTHSLPIIGTVTILAWGIAVLLDLPEKYFVLGLGAGMLLHSLMDLTNTYGIALFTPLGKKRYCSETIFFIDTFVVGLSLICFAFVITSIMSNAGLCIWIAFTYSVTMVLYWILHWRVRRQALHIAPCNTRSLIPSAMLPWYFFGYAVDGDRVEIFEIDVLRRKIQKYEVVSIIDSKYCDLLNSFIEYRLMQELSKGYFATEAIEADGQTQLTCRDLRIRNFGGEFGRLEIVVDDQGNVIRKHLHV